MKNHPPRAARGPLLGPTSPRPWVVAITLGLMVLALSLLPALLPMAVLAALVVHSASSICPWWPMIPRWLHWHAGHKVYGSARGHEVKRKPLGMKRRPARSMRRD